MAPEVAAVVEKLHVLVLQTAEPWSAYDMDGFAVEPSLMSVTVPGPDALHSVGATEAFEATLVSTATGASGAVGCSEQAANATNSGKIVAATRVRVWLNCMKRDSEMGERISLTR